MNLKGGYKLIDLTLIALVLGTPSGDKTAITEPKILDQLLTLREYIEGDKELKPVYIRAKSTNGKDVVMASLARSASGLNYYIDAKFTDTLLKLIVVFEQDEETLEYKIKSAEYLYTADVDNVQNEVTKAEAGTIDKVLGLNEDGELVKGAVSGGTKLYKHVITFNDGHFLQFISNLGEKILSITDLYDNLNLLTPIINFFDNTDHANYYMIYKGNALYIFVNNNLINITRGTLSYIGGMFRFEIDKIEQQNDNTFTSTTSSRTISSITDDTITEI